jgi:hypothetical protein
MPFPSIHPPFAAPTLEERAANSSTHSSRRLSAAAGPRGVFPALAIFVAGVFVFLFALLCTVGLLAESHCGARFNYYGCDIPP